MGIKIDFVKETDEEYEEIKYLMPSASKYALMKVNHFILVPLYQVMDIINKYDKDQELTTKNNLGVDAISREDALMCLTGKFEIREYEPSELVSIFSKRIKALPSVTPQEPKTGHCRDCKWWKDSDGEYRRGCGAESQCPINRKEVYEGNGYCYMFEPQESEE